MPSLGRKLELKVRQKSFVLLTNVGSSALKEGRGEKEAGNSTRSTERERERRRSGAAEPADASSTMDTSLTSDTTSILNTALTVDMTLVTAVHYDYERGRGGSGRERSRGGGGREGSRWALHFLPKLGRQSYVINNIFIYYYILVNLLLNDRILICESAQRLIFCKK